MLCMFYRPDADCFPSQETLQHKCNLGSENTLKKGLKELESRGFIKRVKKYLPGKSYQSTVYEFLAPVSNGDTRHTAQVSNDDTPPVSNNDTRQVSLPVSKSVSKFDTEHRRKRRTKVVGCAHAGAQPTTTKKQYPFFVKEYLDAECDEMLRAIIKMNPTDDWLRGCRDKEIPFDASRVREREIILERRAAAYVLTARKYKWTISKSFRGAA